MTGLQTDTFWGRNRWGYWCILLVLFLAGLGIRLYDLTDLPLDFHPTRQLRSAIIARGIYYEMQPNPDAYRQSAALQAMNSLVFCGKQNLPNSSSA